MSDEKDERLDNDIARGNEARSLLANQLLQETLAMMKKEVIDKWAACPARDVKGREWLWQFYQNTLKFEEKLTEVLNTGKLAFQEKQMSLMEKVRSFTRRQA
jgi:predicted PolB exonuclease-like 3'-5' exonuclease